MSRIFLTGDIHGEISVNRLSGKNWPEGRKLSKQDYLIILGDFGLLWKMQPDRNEVYWLNWLQSRSWTTLFIPGNHENYFRLKQLENVKMFGSEAQKVSDSVFMLKRGEVYTIENKKFFCMGGARSHDKAYRREFISWWPEEEPSQAECEKGLQNLQDHKNKVDYILGHTSSTSAVKRLGEICGQDFSSKSENLNKYFDVVCEMVKFKKFFFGHFHVDENIDGIFHCLYKDIIEIG